MPDGTVNPDIQHDKSRVDWFQEGQEWARRGAENGMSRPGTIEEKLNAMAVLAQERNEPFDRRKERGILHGKARTPYIAADGTPCKTRKLRDKYNADLERRIQAGEQESLGTAGDPGASPYYWPKVKEVTFQSFEALWDEARTELIEAGGYSFINGVLRETPPFFAKDGIGVAYISFTLKRPGLVARLLRAVKEAISG